MTKKTYVLSRHYTGIWLTLVKQGFLQKEDNEHIDILFIN